MAQVRRAGPTRVTRNQERGAIIPLTALMISTLVLLASFAVDLGRVRSERRSLQADADAIALDAVQKINGLTTDLALAAAITEANESADRNDVPVTLTAAEVSVGRWNVATQNLDATAADAYPDAVQIDLSKVVPYFLSAGERNISRTGVAVARAQTMGEIGSVVAGLEPKDPTAGCAVGAAAAAQVRFMNFVYTQLLGISVSGGIEFQGDVDVNENINCQATGPNDGLKLDAGSYRGIGAADLTYGQLATELGFASADDLMNGQVTQKDVIEASGRILSGNGSTANAGAALLAIGAQSNPATQYRFEDSITNSTSAGGTGGGTAAEATISALDLLVATATAIDGNNFVGAGGTFSLPAQLPQGLVNITTKIHVIEGPQADRTWKHQGQDGRETSQVVFTLDVPVAFNNQTVDLTGLGLPAVSATGSLTGTGSIPIVVQVGYAKSRYPRVECGLDGETASDSIVDMEITSGAARVSVGVLSESSFNQNAGVSAAPNPLINGSATVNVTVGAVNVPVNLDLTSLTTVPPTSQIVTSTGNTVNNSSFELNAGGGTDVRQFTSPYATPFQRYNGGIDSFNTTDSVISSVNFGGTSGGTLGSLIGSSSSSLVQDQLVERALRPYANTIDSTIIEPLLDALGATAGGADGRILRVRCQVPAIANQEG